MGREELRQQVRAIPRGFAVQSTSLIFEVVEQDVESKNFFFRKVRVITTYLYTEENGHLKKETFMKW